MPKFLKIIVCIIFIIIVFITSICVGSKIVSVYLLKNDEEIIKDEKTNIIDHTEESNHGLYDANYDGIAEQSEDVMGNDMIFISDVRLYYKIIKDLETYNFYKERLYLKDMKKDDFNTQAVIIIANENVRDEDESNLAIYDVQSKDSVTRVLLRQVGDPGAYSEDNVFCAWVDKDLINDKIEISINE